MGPGAATSGHESWFGLREMVRRWLPRALPFEPSRRFPSSSLQCINQAVAGPAGRSPGAGGEEASAIVR